MVGLSTSSQTTSPWNPSPRRTWQAHQPTCSACYCTFRATITPSFTAPVRKWPCLTHCLLVQATSWTWHPTGHCHPPCSPVPREEGSIPTSLCEQPWDVHSCWHDHHWLAQWHQGSPLPVTPILATSRDPHHVEDGLVLCGEALIIPPCQNGRGYYSNSTSSIKEPPKLSHLHMNVSSSQAQTKP